MDWIQENLGTIGIIAGIILLIIIVVSGYCKAPPDEAYIISGLRKRTLIGRAGIKVPFLERLDKLSLKLISVDVKTATSVPTADYINIRVDSVVNIKISDRSEMIALAAQNFLNQNSNYICGVAREVLEGNVREIVGQMGLQDMVNDRKKFAEKVQENASPDLAAMGLEIVSFNVQNLTDEQGLIENLGIDNTTKIQKTAAITKAEAERDIQIAQAKASKESNDARVQAETEIAQKNNELAIRKAELKKQSDIKQAEADAAYDIQKQEQRKTIEVTSSMADIAKTEQSVLLHAKQAEVQEQALNAEIKKKADADRYRKEQEAQAALFQRSKQAEAELYETQKEAEAQKAKAEAMKFAKLQEAEGIRAVGEAEANAVKAKLLAEAEGLDRKAEAMQKMQEAAVLQMYFEVLPQIAKAIAEPLASVDSITMYGEGNTAKMIEDITKSTNQVSAGMLDGIGIDLKSMINSFVTGKAIGMGMNPPDNTTPPTAPTPTTPTES
ncbi:flotillin [Ruminococcus sp. YE71]|uniref:flotillin family protein n=1 Tax=unclassified Ruminococcus TaxID=2608920 RepID=UPI00088E50E1|nr:MULTISPECIES: flotillin family protein [unclassified Ruminococcus]SDA23484.1 flotillin [Ruminococcus sp. YE78]SFW39839.1 flotillin [Ruminococcus sp. YE71]